MATACCPPGTAPFEHRPLSTTMTCCHSLVRRNRDKRSENRVAAISHVSVDHPHLHHPEGNALELGYEAKRVTIYHGHVDMMFRALRMYKLHKAASSPPPAKTSPSPLLNPPPTPHHP
ncbi:unnamed protein product [Boreogadus saida]